jgi:hypothetical protein
VHADDEADNGRITRLARSVENEYQMLTGEEIDVFLDRDDIRWGEEWRRRIDEALEGTAFFIPVVTPRYFQSKECREELLTFAGHAESLGAVELLLPLLYVDVPALRDEDVNDEALLLVARTQYENWTALRLEEEDAAEYRKAVNGLAQRLVQISREVASRPLPDEVVGGEETPEDTEGTAAEKKATEADEGEDEERGTLDILADAEEALPRWVEALTEITKALDEINELSQARAAELANADQAGKGFAGRLRVMRGLANDLEEPASRVSQLGTRYASELVNIDSGVLTLIRLGEEDQLDDETVEALCELFETIRVVAATSRESATTLSELSQTLHETGKFSRDLRAPLGKIQDGLRNVRDGQAIIAEWLHQIERSSLPCEDGSSSASIESQ